MAPLPRVISYHLIRRDQTLSAGAIAGIIVGIVVVALILLGIFIWRLLALRETFGGQAAREKAQNRGKRHIRSTRPQDMIGTNGNKKVEDGEDKEDLEEEERPSPIVEDDRSLNDTINENEEEEEAERARQAEKTNQQERDFEIFQGHQERT